MILLILFLLFSEKPAQGYCEERYLCLNGQTHMMLPLGGTHLVLKDGQDVPCGIKYFNMEPRADLPESYRL